MWKLYAVSVVLTDIAGLGKFLHGITLAWGKTKEEAEDGYLGKMLRKHPKYTKFTLLSTEVTQYYWEYLYDQDHPPIQLTVAPKDD